tara:strand:- start:14957 stop:15385 length:429 start_codon:yes stop_codon:yes gene_type:complete
MSNGTTNKVILIGNLGKDPEMRQAGATSVTNLTLATTESWKDKTSGEKTEKTEWHRVNFWGGQAEALSTYAKKGAKLYVEGRLETRTYEKDGETKYSTEIRGNSFEFLDSKKGEVDDGGSQNFKGQSTPPDPRSTGDDDLPF